MHILRAFGNRLLKPPMQHNWLQDRKLTQTCWCLHWSRGLRIDVLKTPAGAYETCSYTSLNRKSVQQNYINSVCHLCQCALELLLTNDRGSNPTASTKGKGQPSKTVLITSVFFNVAFKRSMLHPRFYMHLLACCLIPPHENDSILCEIVWDESHFRIPPFLAFFVIL